jgi:hypothetical protein
VVGGVTAITVTEAAGSITTALVDNATITGTLTGTNAAGPAFENSAATATNPTLIPNKADLDTGVGWVSSGFLSFVTDGAQAGGFEDPADLGAQESSLWLYDLDNATIVQVTFGAPNSGGAGLKALVVPN